MSTLGNEAPFDFDGAYGGDYEYIARTVIPGYRSSFRQALALLGGRVGPGPRVLVVGAGTGIELVTFKAAEPGWRLTGIDPSRQMIEIARDADVREAGVGDGVETGVRLVHGHVSDLDEDGFDAATCFNVMHFLPDDGAKQALLRDIARPPRARRPLPSVRTPRRPERAQLRRTLRRVEPLLGDPGDGRGGARRVPGQDRRGHPLGFRSPDLRTAGRAGFEDTWRYYRALLYGAWISLRAL